MSTKEQRLARAVTEILRAFEEDKAAAFIPGNRAEIDTHEDRLRALEAAMAALLSVLANGAHE